IAQVVRDLRPEYIDGMDEESVAAEFPPIDDNVDVLRWVRLAGLTIPGESRESTEPLGIAFAFYWDNEHPLGVTWREGDIVYKGDSEAADWEAAGVPQSN
ncbi:MAG: hypothetical protein AAGK78_01605, partial [Planctomycetota bacterium]